MIKEEALSKNLSRKRIGFFSLLAALLLSSSGCIYLVVGGIGAVGGYVVSPDTVEGLTEYDELDLWDASFEVASVMGVIKKQSEGVGEIQALINGATVNITVEPLSEDTSKLSVKSRKYHLPKISVAQDVFVKIMTKMLE